MANEIGVAEQLVDAEDRLTAFECDAREHAKKAEGVREEIDRHKKLLGNLVRANNRTRNILVGKRLVRVEYVPKGALEAFVRVTVEPVEVA